MTNQLVFHLTSCSSFFFVFTAGSLFLTFHNRKPRSKWAQSLSALPIQSRARPTASRGASWSLWITNKDKHRFIWCLLRYVRSNITQSCRYPCRGIWDSEAETEWRIHVDDWGWTCLRKTCTATKIYHNKRCSTPTVAGVFPKLTSKT